MHTRQFSCAVFARLILDRQRCPNCGAREIKIIGAVLQGAVIGKILPHQSCIRGRYPAGDRFS
jgi:hypothetical protein